MPEIKNTFTQGRMNKDLDERIIPNGEYRDALNVKVNSSDDASIGTVQNILGNLARDTSGIVPSDYLCIATIADEKTNKLYWFVTKELIPIHAILQYDLELKKVKIVLLDKNNSTLKFTRNIITGINIIDNLLFWTDNNSEPKKLNIDDCIKGSVTMDLDTAPQTVLVDADGVPTFVEVEEKYITVIKKAPRLAPFTTILPNYNLSKETPLFEKVFPRFSYRYKYKDGEYSSFGPFTEVIFKPIYKENINIDNAYSLEEGNNTGMTNNIKAILFSKYNYENTPDDVVQIELLYKEEGSSTVFSVKKINNDDYSWVQNRFVLESQDMYSAIPENQLLRSWDNVPLKALSQEVTGNRIVYGNYTQGRNLITSDSSKAVGIISANYEQRNLNYFPANSDVNLGGVKSLKSKREYSIGYVWGDKYGRETPVLDNTKSVSIPWFDSEINLTASSSTSLQVSLMGNKPYWADYYKFYIKEKSGEYYNLLMEKAYFTEKVNIFNKDEERIWLGFISADRNKVSEDGYITLKKKIGGSERQVALDNKFKILDIQNEAPNAIKYKYVDLGTVTQTTLSGSGVLQTIFSDQDNRPDDQIDMLYIHRAEWVNSVGGSLQQKNDNAEMWVDAVLYASWKDTVTGQHSERYKIISSVHNGTEYMLKLDRVISETDAGIAKNDDATLLSDNLQFSIQKREEIEAEEFGGKFFVQISSLSTVQPSPEINNLENFQVTSNANTFWFYDDATTTVFGPGTTTPSPEPATVASVSTMSITDYTNTPEEWEELATTFGNSGKGFFIDNLYMAAGQMSSSNYAKSTGRTWFGRGDTHAPAPLWTALATEDTSGAPTINPSNRPYGWGTQALPNLPDGEEGLSLPLINSLFDLSTYTSRSGTSWGAGMWSQGQFLNTQSIPHIPRTVQSMEGIFTTSSKHYLGSPFPADNGYRRWRKEGNISQGGGNVPNYWSGLAEQTYGNESGVHYMQISFLAPGENLHDGQFDGLQDDCRKWGEGSIGNYLQAIWGGGIFAGGATGDSPNFTLDNYLEDNTGLIVEMEGNYDSVTNLPLEDAPAPGVGYGYDTSQDYADKHNNQWNPFWKNDPDGKVKAFINNISEGSTFVFPSAPDERFTILANPIVKKIYNHTVWNRDYQYNGTDYTELSGSESVRNRVLKWANDTAGSGDQTSSMTNLQEAITNFGKANNRRVVYIFPVDKNPLSLGGISNSSANFNTELSLNIQFVSNDSSSVLSNIMTEPAIWETEPKETKGLDIYYEASQAYPTVLTNKTNVEFAPVGCYVEISATSARNGQFLIDAKMRLVEWIDENTFKIASKAINGFNSYETDGFTLVNYEDALVTFYRRDGSYTTAKITGQPGVANVTEIENIDENGVGYGSYQPILGEYYNTFTIQELDASLGTGLGYYNCFSFGNGIESNRIRDDFNSPTIRNGVKASIVLESDYKEEKRKSGLIFSGIYNSNSGVNNLNQFIMAENITKDLNPTYGSIQKLFQRRISLVALCEDKIVSVTSNKDALFNADGNAQLVSTNAVLGDATPFVGDFGISKNPESFAKESYRAYFTDKQRGAVLRLSMDGLTAISDSGMNDYFRDNLKISGQIVGSYDAHSKDYNLSLRSKVASDNLISNAFLNDGNNLNLDIPIGSIDSIRNGNVNYSIPLNLPSENLTVNQGFGELNNRYLNFQVDITNHEEILMGSLAGQTFNTNLLQTSFKTFSNSAITVNQMSFHGSSNSGNPFVATGSGFGGTDKKYIALRTYTSTFVTENNAGNVLWPGTSAGLYESASGNWYTGLSPSFPNLLRGPSADIFWNPIEDGYFAQGPIANESPFNSTSSHRNPWFNTTSSPNSGRGICFDKTSSAKYLILPGDKVNSNDVTTPALVLAKYPGAVPTTVFNGEEIRIVFNARGMSYISPNSPQTGTSSDHYRYVTIHLYDGATALTNSVIMDPTTLQGSITQGYADYDYVPLSQTSQGTSDECRIGFQTTVDVDFPLLEHNTVRAHDVSFKFTNGTDESEAIIVQDLRVHIRFVDDDGNEVDELYGSIETFSMQKQYYMSDVDGFTMNSSPNGDFVPAEDIDAWAEVDRVGFNSWVLQDEMGGSIDEEDFAPTSLINFGIDYIAVPTDIVQIYSANGVTTNNIVPTFLMPPDPSGTNGVVAYNDYTTGSEAVNDKFVWVGDGNNHNYLYQSFTATAGEKYAIALTQPSSPTGDAPSLEDYNLPFVLTQVHFDFEPDQPLIDAYLCIFDGDDSISELKIKLPSNASFEIATINMIKVTEIWSGGTAAEWNFNLGTSGNPDPETSFDTPKLYATDSDGISFNNPTGGGYTSAFQEQNNLENAGSINNTGGEDLKLSFTATGVSQGALSFHLVDDNGDGQWGQNIIDRDGFYEIDLNLDSGAYDVKIDGTVTHQTQDVANLGTNQTNILNFSDSAGFVGNIDEIKLTNLQELWSGGDANNFTFSGFDPSTNDYIVFNTGIDGNGVIEFNNCPPIDPNTNPITFCQIEQVIEEETGVGELYRIRFDYNITEGFLYGYYYNQDGDGFVIAPSGVSGIGTYNQLHTIETPAQQQQNRLTNTFVIYANNTSGGFINGFIDNIMFRQEFLTGNEQTISFSENVRGWTSFKSFIPEQGVSLSSSYFTFNTGQIYEHGVENEPRNNFYGVPYTSSITTVLNAEPSIVKSFNTLNYEGSQSNVVQYKSITNNGNEYNTLDNYNYIAKPGWSVEYIKTNKQEGNLKEFIEKEGKWFNYIKGSNDPSVIDTGDLSFQGLGTIKRIDQ